MLARIGVVCWCAAFLWAPFASPARAQDAEARARAVFQEGLELADHGDWATAATRFATALEAHDAPPLRFNLARCFDRLGRLVEALEQLDALESGGHATPAVRSSAQRLRDEIAPRIGRLVVQLRRGDPTMRVEIDNHPLDAAELDQPVLADPGTRHIALWRGDRELDAIDVVVAEGGVSHVVLTAPDGGPAPSVDPALAADPAPPLEVAPPERSSDLAAQWWLWTIVGVVVVGAGVGIAVGVVASQPPEASVSGDFQPGVIRIGG